MLLLLVAMRKLLLTFSVTWAVYCLINTGYIITQPKWREILRQSPAAAQVQAGDIFNHGAFLIKNTDTKTPNQVTLFVEKDLGFLSALPLGYWLYPTKFIPASNDPLNAGESVTNPVEALSKTLKTQPKTIYFFGQQKTIDASTNALQDYKKTLVVDEDSFVFYILEKQ